MSSPQIRGVLRGLSVLESGQGPGRSKGKSKGKGTQGWRSGGEVILGEVLVVVGKWGQVREGSPRPTGKEQEWGSG